jgi:hypothetical protein
MLELPSTYIKLVLQPLLVHLVDVRAGVVFLMESGNRTVDHNSNKGNLGFEAVP